MSLNYIHKYVIDERERETLVNKSHPANPNSFMALANQFSVSAWFLGFFCAKAKETTWTVTTTGQNAVKHY